MSNSPTKQPQALRSDIWLRVWVAGAAGVVALDCWRMTKNDGSTLSEAFRAVFHTDTPEGKALFLSALGVFAAHIVTNKP